MPDLIQFSVVRSGTASLTVPVWTISGKLVDSATQQTVLQDFTGGNSVSFPQVLGNLTNAQQDELVNELVLGLLRRRFPNAF